MQRMKTKILHRKWGGGRITRARKTENAKKGKKCQIGEQCFMFFLSLVKVRSVGMTFCVPLDYPPKKIAINW